MTAKELRKFYGNQLDFLKFNKSQDQLDYLLKQAADRVLAFFRDFSNVASKEQVKLFQAKNSLNAGNVYISESRDEEYQYLILPGSRKSETSWVEDRTDKRNRSVNQKDLQGFFISSGYAGYCLYLHPGHQGNSHFRYLGRETKKPGAHVIVFAQKPEAGNYFSKYSEGDSSTPIRYLVQGLVWLDPDIIASEKALRRAARRALEIGLETSTPVYVIRRGKIVDLTKDYRGKAKRK
jgi:hypothetical protein